MRACSCFWKKKKSRGAFVSREKRFSTQHTVAGIKKSRSRLFYGGNGGKLLQQLLLLPLVGRFFTSRLILLSSPSPDGSFSSSAPSLKLFRVFFFCCCCFKRTLGGRVETETLVLLLLLLLHLIGCEAEPSDDVTTLRKPRRAAKATAKPRSPVTAPCDVTKGPPYPHSPDLKN